MSATVAVDVLSHAIAVAIAGVGLFGVRSYMTSQRTREIGIRTALGATTSNVVRLVVRQAMMTTVGGLIAGLTTAYVVNRWPVSSTASRRTTHSASRSCRSC